MNNNNSIYPSLPFESNYIRKYRLAAQHDVEHDEFIMFLFFRPFSIYFSILIFKYTKITANTITLVMTILGVLGPLLVVFSETLAQVVIISCFYILGTSLLDVIDGEVARLRGVESKTGVVLDASLWFYYPLMYVMVVVSISYIVGIERYLPFLVLVGVFHELYCAFSIKIFNEDYVSMKHQKLKQKLIKLPFSKTIYLTLLFPLFLLLNKENFVMAFIVYTAVISILYTLNSTVNLTRFISKSN